MLSCGVLAFRLLHYDRTLVCPPPRESLLMVRPTKACWGLARPMSFPALPADHAGLNSPEEWQDTKFGWIYLAPELEDQDDRIIAAVVAHEIAHVIIGDVCGRECEVKADALIFQVGISSELDKLRENNPNHRY